MWLRTGRTWTKCGFKTMLLPLFLIWFVITYSYSEVWELLMNCCNRRCVILNHYDLGLFSVWFEIPRDFVDYWSYMSSSLRIWSLRWFFLDLCSYNLDGSVTKMLCHNNIINLILSTPCFIKEYYYKYSYVIKNHMLMPMVQDILAW
jgi:hypothetical protein